MIPKELDLKALAKKAKKNEQLIQMLIDELNNSKARIKYGSLNTLVLISEKELIPASNIVKGSSVIIQSKPDLADKIISKLLLIRTNDYETKECKEILKGQTVDLFYKFFDKLPQKEKIKAFVKDSLNSTRNSTRKKAEKFMKRYK